MKNLLISISAIAAMCAAICSCTEEELPPVSPEFILETSEISISAEGGNYEILYSIKNPSENGKVVPETQAEWISMLDASVPDVITFTAESNCDPDPREAVIEIKYEGKTYEVTVKQDTEKTPEPEPGAVFAFEIKEVKETSLKFSIFPADKEMTYIGMLNEKDYMDQFASDEEYFIDDMNFFKEAALNYGISIEEYLANILKTGDVEDEYVNMLDPETEYYVYAYGLNTDIVYLTDLHKTETKTEPVQMNGMTFDIGCIPYKNTVELTIVPSDPEQTYLYSIYPQTEVSKDGIAGKYWEYVSTIMMIYIQQFGITPEEFIEDAAYTGTVNATMDDLLDDTPYWAFAVSVAPFGVFNSEVSVEEFTTGVKYTSDNTFALSFSKPTESTVDYKIITANNDPYIMFVDKYSKWADYMDDMEAIQEELLSGDYDLESRIRRGDESGTITGLDSKTEYVVYIFGYENGNATTELYDGNFMTATPEAGATFRLEYDKYFDGTEMEALDPEAFAGASGKAVLPVKAVTTGNATGYYYDIFKGDYTDTSVITDDIAISSVRFTGKISPAYVYFINYDELNTFMGVAVDAGGNFGPVWREAVTLTPEGASPASEYPF